MATKSTCKTLQKVGPNEPIFVLRARDITAASTVAFWLGQNESNLSPERKDEVVACINAMQAWPEHRAAD